MTSPNGFSMACYQSCWDIVKRDLMKVFKEFFGNGKVGKSMNLTFITLIPKKDRSVNIKDYIPISLVTSVYKILAKVLVNSIKVFLGDKYLCYLMWFC